MSPDRNQDDSTFLAQDDARLHERSHARHHPSYLDAGRRRELTLPHLSEHIIGQLMQMLMLATVMEGHLMESILRPTGVEG